MRSSGEDGRFGLIGMIDCNEKMTEFLHACAEKLTKMQWHQKYAGPAGENGKTKQMKSGQGKTFRFTAAFATSRSDATRVLDDG